MRVLIYGFGPYRHFNVNVSEKILRLLPKHRWLKRIVFPVRFKKHQFLRAVRNACPDIVLGLGQCSGGKRLRVESMAVNQRRNASSDKPRAILVGGPPALTTSLKFNLGSKARPSRDAGTYVCNYSMYVILEMIKRNRLPIRFGFVHIPYDYDARKACWALQKAITRVRLQYE